MILLRESISSYWQLHTACAILYLQIKKKGEQMKKQNFKVILLTSIVWLIVIAGVVAVVKYGEYQKTQGMLDGFTKAKEILIQK